LSFFAIFFLIVCGGSNVTIVADTDALLLGDEDPLLGDEDGIVPTDEEEPEGEGIVTKDDAPIAKDDAPVVTDDAPVVTDDAPVVTDDDTGQPDEEQPDEEQPDEELTDETIPDEFFIDEEVTDDVVTDDVVTDELLTDDDTITTYTIGWCNLQWPTDPTVTSGDDITVYGRVYVAGLTDLSTAVDSAEELVVQMGLGTIGTDAETWNWGSQNIEPNPDNASAPEIGENDEYIFSTTADLPAGTYAFTFRFSGDGGATWTYCNANRPGDGYNGTDAEHPFEENKAGLLTVESGYVDPCLDPDACTEEHRGVCTDADLDGVAECACDLTYHLDTNTGTCVSDTRNMPCTNLLPLNASWK
ncbi:MAG TPA: hypothetical protein PKH10_14125, partial [bacterium]|nr:hypothetical protein [bacterium]